MWTFSRSYKREQNQGKSDCILYRDENDEEGQTVGFLHQEDNHKSKELEQLIVEDPEHVSKNIKNRNCFHICREFQLPK